MAISPDQLKVLENAITKWGIQNQIHKIQEEALELALVLNQSQCPTKDKNEMYEKIYDELADMAIMMEQAHLLFDSNKITERVNFKIKKMQTKYGL